MDQQQTSQIPDDVRKFLESLIFDSHITLVDEAMKEEMVQELYQRLDKYLTGVIINNLPPEQLDSFVKLNEEKKSKEEVETFLKANMPNVEEIFAQAFIDFRDLYLGKTS